MNARSATMVSMILCAGHAGACSGPNVQADMAQAVIHAHIWGGLQVILLVTSLWAGNHTKRWGIPIAQAIVLLIDPAWWVSAYSGDCGTMKEGGAFLFICIAAALLTAQVFQKGSR